MTQMAILQDVDKCMRCNGCVVACKREWNMKFPTDIAEVKPARALVSASQRVAIKSQKRGDMGPFVRYSCWHCPTPPCAGGCPFGAIKKLESGAVAVDNTLCKPSLCSATATKPCQTACERGGYPKPGLAYAVTDPADPRFGTKMNKCTLCTGRAGSDAQITAAGGDPALGLPTRATDADIAAVPEKAHEPACVSSCPAKAMKWDTQANILAYLEANFIWGAETTAPGTKNWIGNGAMFWASRKVLMAPPKADPFVEDHVAPLASGLSGKLLVPTLVVGGLAALSARRSTIENDGEV